MLSAPHHYFCLQGLYEALMKEMQSSDKYGLERLSLPKRKVVLQFIMCWHSPPHTTQASALALELYVYSPQRAVSSLQLIPMILNGTAPLYLLSTMYVVAGALLGAPAGVEFTTAIQAANQVCYLD